MINVSETEYHNIIAKVGSGKSKAPTNGKSTNEEENPSQTQTVKSSIIIGADHIENSRREGIAVTDISMSIFERRNLGKNIVFIEEDVVETNTMQIMQIHSEISEYMKISLQKAVKIGELLFEQKKRIIRGGFIYWVKETMPFSVRTGQNYMKVFHYNEEFQNNNITSLSDAYALVNGEAMPDEVISPTDSTNTTSGCVVTGAMVSMDGFELPKRRAKGLMRNLIVDKELVNRMANEEYPFGGEKEKYIKLVVDISRSIKGMEPKLLGEFIHCACDYLKDGGKLILHKKG